jgi:multimeric flavodoxin WrbA
VINLNIYINGSNREKNCFNVLNDIKEKHEKIISLTNQDIKFCKGCNACNAKLDKLCILDDYITNEVYPKILEADNIIIASPIYMSNITGLLKNLIDRFNPFYNHQMLKEKRIFLILIGQGTKEENQEEIRDIIKWIKGISEWIPFKFKFLEYFSSGDILKIDDVKINNKNYEEIIKNIKYQIK